MQLFYTYADNIILLYNILKFFKCNSYPSGVCFFFQTKNLYRGNKHLITKH